MIISQNQFSGTYEEARAHLYKAEVTSDLSDIEEATPGKRRRTMPSRFRETDNDSDLILNKSMLPPPPRIPIYLLSV
jgi:hypothetical protein